MKQLNQLLALCDVGLPLVDDQTKLQNLSEDVRRKCFNLENALLKLKVAVLMDMEKLRAGE